MAAKKENVGRDAIGYLVWYTMPELDAPYGALVDLAGRVGLDEDYVPDPPTPRNAWRKATSLTKTIDIPLYQLPTDLVARVRAAKKGDPRVYLTMREVTRTAPLLRRHLVREAVLPKANNVKEQLDLGTVAVFEFNCDVNRAISAPIRDESGWTDNGLISGVVQDIDQQMAHATTYADAQELRAVVRAVLDSLHNLCLRGTGGVYFVPETALNAERDLRSLRKFVGAMDQWSTGRLTPMISLVHLRGEDAFEMAEEIALNAIDQFKGRLSNLSKKLQPIFSGSSKGKTAENISTSALAEYGKINDAVKAYRESLGIEMQELDDILLMAKASVNRAQNLAI